MKNNMHVAYLNIGSNIEPEHHLREAVRLLGNHGKVSAISNTWQSHARGFDGPDFLNACVQFETSLEAGKLKEEVIRPIETQLGRVRGPDEFSSRTIDIDIILFDDELYGGELWSQAFVVVPLADLLPDFEHPIVQKSLAWVAGDLRRKTWMVARPEVLTSR